MKIDVWSDFVCPFCYIGKRQLENAVEQFSNRDAVEIAYKSYELDPNSELNPGRSMDDYMVAEKGMSYEQARSMNDNIKQQAAQVGLTYNMDDMQLTNSFDAHRVAKYASKNGKGEEMAERLFKAYFTDSELISDYTTLSRLAGEVGLDENSVTEMLRSDDYTDYVRADEKEAGQLGAQGVPFFVFNEKYAVSGAQSQEAFSDVLERVWEEEKDQPAVQSLNPDKSKTTFCTDEGCTTPEED